MMTGDLVDVGCEGCNGDDCIGLLGTTWGRRGRRTMMTGDLVKMKLMRLRFVMVIVLSYWGQPKEGEGGGRWWQVTWWMLVVRVVMVMIVLGYWRQPEEGEGGGWWWQVTWLMLVVRVVMVMIVLSYWGQPEEGEGGGRWWQVGISMIILVIKVTNKLVEIGLMLAMRFVMVMIVLVHIGSNCAQTGFENFVRIAI